MVKALEDLSKCTFANLFYDLEAEADLVVLGDTVVAIAIIIAIINYPLGLGGMYLEFIGS